MFKITILAVGKIKNQAIAQSIDKYLKRLKPLAKVEMVELPAVSFSANNQNKAMAEEAQKILKYLDKHQDAQPILLDEAGKTMTSATLADFLENNSPLILIIGGSLGLGTELKATIKDKIALSKLTLPHELALLILTEQIYRAVTIIKKMDYHH